MVTRSIQGYVELASGLGEMTRARAVEAAQEIIALGASDASRKKAAKQAAQLADGLLRAAEENRRQVVALVQREVENAVDRIDVGRLVAEVQALAATVAALAAQVEELARAAAAARGITIPTTGLAVVEDAPEPARVAPRPVPTSTTRPAKKAAGTTPAASKSTATKSTAKKATATRSTAKKSTAKKATGKKATAKKSVATTSTAKKSPAKKSTAKKSTAKKSPATTSTSTATTSTSPASTPTVEQAPATSTGTAPETPKGTEE
jgi:polyhydroxyalkanoate synthesis regulator phasin